MLRGYEYTVADGQSFMVSNNTLKYNILPKRTFTLNWLSWLPKFSKIHLSVYANAILIWDMPLTNLFTHLIRSVTNFFLQEA
jgi:hypothetical protein